MEEVIQQHEVVLVPEDEIDRGACELVERFRANACLNVRCSSHRWLYDMAAERQTLLVMQRESV